MAPNVVVGAKHSAAENLNCNDLAVPDFFIATRKTILFAYTRRRASQTTILRTADCIRVNALTTEDFTGF